MSQQSNNILDSVLYHEEEQNANTPIWSDFLNMTGLEGEPDTNQQSSDKLPISSSAAKSEDLIIDVPADEPKSTGTSTKTMFKSPNMYKKLKK